MILEDVYVITEKSSALSTKADVDVDETEVLEQMMSDIDGGKCAVIKNDKLITCNGLTLITDDAVKIQKYQLLQELLKLYKD